MGKLFEIYGHDAHEMTIALMEAAEVAARIPTGAQVALKPNLLQADTADHGAVTHPGVLSGCIEYLRAHGISRICVMESAWIGDQTERACRTSGCAAVCEKYGVLFYDLKKDRTVTVETPFRRMEICARAYEADFLIDLPVLKGHCQTVMTCALKNLKGCIPDREKRQFHADGLTRPIAALASVLRPRLVIVDSICGDLNFEEGGNPVQTNRMYLGWDAVQVDAYGCRLMGLAPEDVTYLPLAAQWGAGELSLAGAEVVALNEPDEGDVYPQPSGLVRRLTRSVQQDRACSACFASLVRALYTLQSGGQEVSVPIAIGQGWQGKRFDGVGIGKCCAGAARCVKGCPPTAREIALSIAPEPGSSRKTHK